MNDCYPRAQLIDAFNAADPSNPLTIKISAAIDRLAHLLAAQSSADGGLPAALEVPTPSTDIELFAFDVFRVEISTLGVEVRLVTPRCQA